MLRTSLFALSFLLCFFFNNAQSRFDKVQIKAHQIKDNIYMLEGSGGNIGVYIGQKEILIVDSQYAPLSDKIIAAIKEISDLPITFLVNTHWHGDHTGGNENFSQQGATLVAHDNVLKRQREGNNSARRKTPPAAKDARVDITFADKISLNVNEYDIMVQHVDNAHTDGDAFVLFKNDNVLHMGDCFFNGRFPYIDLSSGGDPNGYINAVEGALMMTDAETVIIPGHGQVATQADLKSFHKMLKSVIGKMEVAMKDTDQLDQIDASAVLEGYDEGWGSGFISNERFMQILFKGL